MLYTSKLHYYKYILSSNESQLLLLKSELWRITKNTRF